MQNIIKAKEMIANKRDSEKYTWKLHKTETLLAGSVGTTNIIH